MDGQGQSEMLELLKRGLPKWPQHLVTGVPVSAEQAMEIIRRTDTFFVSGWGGNNHKFDRTVRQLMGMPPDYFDRVHQPELPSNASEAEKKARRALVIAEQELENRQREAFAATWAPIETNYVRNSWVSNSFIGGPHGWCHPDGDIGFVDNVGKWPSVEDVFEDWQKLAQAFPFLDIGATLMSGEECEAEGEEGTVPIVSIRVLDGVATLVNPSKTDVHEGHSKPTRRAGANEHALDDFKADHWSPSREQGLPAEWFIRWAKEKLGREATSEQALMLRGLR